MKEPGDEANQAETRARKKVWNIKTCQECMVQLASMVHVLETMTRRKPGCTDGCDLQLLKVTSLGFFLQISEHMHG